MRDERQPPAIGIALRDPYPWDVLASLTRAAEERGYRALFLPEIGGRDTLAAVTGLAGETQSILMGPGVAPLGSRTPQLLAMAVATAQERSGGRLLLGLGTGPAGPGALERLRATVIGLHEVFVSGVGTVEGERIALGLVPAAPPPLWIAALGPRAARLAGEVADGVLLNWCTPERVARACAEVAARAEGVGRDPAEITVAVYLRVALGSAREHALAAAAEYASYPAYARQFAQMGLDPGDPGSLVDAVCLTGEPQQARERLGAYRHAGAELPVVYPVAAPGDRGSPGAAQLVLRTLEIFAPSP